jgi:hypothetical protein
MQIRFFSSAAMALPGLAFALIGAATPRGTISEPSMIGTADPPFRQQGFPAAAIKSALLIFTVVSPATMSRPPTFKRSDQRAFAGMDPEGGGRLHGSSANCLALAETNDENKIPGFLALKMKKLITHVLGSRPCSEPFALLSCSLSVASTA